MVKTYVLDTNILINSAGDILDGLADNNIVITHTTLEELDKHKSDPGEKGFAVRESLRKILAYKDNPNGDYETGYPTEHGGTFRIEMNHVEGEYLPKDWDMTKNDNKIISTATYLMHTLSEPVILITNDSGMYVNATLAGLAVQQYKNEQVNTDTLYTGRTEITVPADALERLYKEKTLPAKDILPVENDIEVNEFLILHCGMSSALAYTDTLMDVHLLEEEKSFGDIRGKNAGQRFALHALLAPASEIPLVVLRGAAGCGKTFLALSAGLSKVYDDHHLAEYDNVIISRSNTLAGGERENLGYLPGSLEEKMGPLLAPFYDNLKSILRGDSKEDPEQIKIQADDLLTSDLVEICAFAYLRGRSIANSYMIIDEAQNLSVSQIRTLVTRAGVGTKLVVLGDINQIDAPHIDKRTSGLSYICEKFKGNPLCMQVALTENECVRSPLANEAARIL